MGLHKHLLPRNGWVWCWRRRRRESSERLQKVGMRWRKSGIYSMCVACCTDIVFCLVPHAGIFDGKQVCCGALSSKYGSVPGTVQAGCAYGWSRVLTGMSFLLYYMHTRVILFVWCVSTTHTPWWPGLALSFLVGAPPYVLMYLKINPSIRCWLHIGCHCCTVYLFFSLRLSMTATFLGSYCCGMPVFVFTTSKYFVIY